MIRSIVFRLAANNDLDQNSHEYVMVLMAGAQQVSWNALRKYLGVSRVAMANAEELRDVTGYEIGAVSPFGLPRPIRALADASVFVPHEISIGSGVRGVTVILLSEDLKARVG